MIYLAIILIQPMKQLFSEDNTLCDDLILPVRIPMQIKSISQILSILNSIRCFILERSPFCMQGFIDEKDRYSTTFQCKGYSFWECGGKKQDFAIGYASLSANIFVAELILVHGEPFLELFLAQLSCSCPKLIF